MMESRNGGWKFIKQDDKKYMQVIFGRNMMRLEKHFESFRDKIS
jgi:hypothetical protein